MRKCLEKCNSGLETLLKMTNILQKWDFALSIHIEM